MALVLGLALAACGTAPPLPVPATTAALDCARAVEPRYQSPTVQGIDGGLDALFDQLDGRRVVLVGEQHDRLDHHLHQLAIICGLLEQTRAGDAGDAAPVPLAIGLEAFQVPFQRHLDDYLAGHIEEDELLERTEYYQRWRFDYRLYAPILRLARRAGLAVVALNAPGELTRAVARGGLDGLDASQRAQVPGELLRSGAAAAGPGYRARLEAVFGQHGGHTERNFEHFLQAQLLWDETMAERAVRFLQTEPRHRLVVLAGVGHVAHADAIPERLRRRLAVRAAALVPDPVEPLPDGDGDGLRYYALHGETLALPPAGLLGVFLDATDDGEGMRVTRFTENSAARDHGVEVGDRLTAINGRGVTAFEDIRLALWDAAPGSSARLRLRRGAAERARQLELTVELR